MTFFSPVCLHLSASSIATRMACALSGAGIIPSAFENCTAASKVASCLTARASTPALARRCKCVAVVHQRADAGGHTMVAQPAGVDARRDEGVAEGVHLDNGGRGGLVAPVK